MSETGLESEKNITFELNIDSSENQAQAIPLHFRKEALSTFDREFKLSNESPSLSVEDQDYLKSAQKLVGEKEFELAQSCYLNLLKLNPDCDEAARGLALCAQNLNQHEVAIEAFRRTANRMTSPAAQLKLAKVFYDYNYDEEAMLLYEKILLNFIPEGDELFDVYKNIGNLKMRTGDPDGAEEFYNKAYALNPESDVLMVNFGSLSLFRGQYDVALIRFREAASKNHLNDKAWVGLGMIHREYGDFELAWANIEKALDINPQNGSAIKLVADWALKDNQIEKALSRFSKLVQLEVKNAWAAMWHAKFLYFSGMLQKAKLEIERALQLDPNLDGAMEVYNVIQEEIKTQLSVKK